VLGEKSRLFTGAGDAHAWRRAAYAAAGVEAAAAWPAYPPRSITIVDRRGTRGIANLEAVLALVAATGLPHRVVRVSGGWAWSEQVRAFADTGILIAVHGAVLANVIYMPPRAAVLEVVPFLGSTPVFRRIAEAARVVYHPIYARAPSAAALRAGAPGLQLYNESAYVAACREAGLSSADAALLVQCNVAPKNAFVEVPLDELARELAQALDEIGCRNSICMDAQGGRTNYLRPASEVAEAAQLLKGEQPAAAAGGA